MFLSLFRKLSTLFIRLYDLDILFEIPFEEDMFIIINFCTPYGKKYIWLLDINEERVSIDRFKTKLKNRLKVEVYTMDSSNLCLDVKVILLVELYDSLCSWPLHISKKWQSSFEIVWNTLHGVFGSF